MLKVGGKPIMEHIVDRLISFGITRLFISVRYLAEKIQEYFGDGTDKGIQIKYIEEGSALGTAGSLSLVEDFRSEEILLMNSDIFTNADYEKMFLKMRETKADMVVASTEYKIDVPYAVLQCEGSVIQDFQEKPTQIFHSNAGIYILSKELIRNIPINQFYDITDLIEKCLIDGKKIVHDPILGHWTDIGNLEQYERVKHSIEI